jgi:hypothetical protein
MNDFFKLKKDFKRFQKISKDFKRFQKISKDFKRFQKKRFGAMRKNGIYFR